MPRWVDLTKEQDDVHSAERREMFAAIDRFIVKLYGERCQPVCSGCRCCIAWAARDMLNTVIEDWDEG